MTQIHKKFSDDQVKGLLSRYVQKEIGREYIQEILGIKRRRFFDLLKDCKNDPENFSVAYNRSQPRRIGKKVEDSILKELAIEKAMIERTNVPLKSYNYSYIKDILANNYNQRVSLPTIINLARENGFYLKKKIKHRLHDREVLTNYPGELIQHDSSHHLWAPEAKEKWYLITSIDDYSRFILYATLVKRETSWRHIQALQALILKYGYPYAYYVDSHSIFRFVQGRDLAKNKAHKLTDEAPPH